VAFAAEHGVPFEQILEARLSEHLQDLPSRYRDLATEVLMELPERWDSHAVWTMKADALPEGPDHQYAGARLLNKPDSDHSIQVWEIVLCPERLDGLSDAAVRGVIVHEFAHVASGLPTDPAVRNEMLCENRADNIAKWWGFEDDLKALGVVY
jgi:hypothetical protein